MIKKFKCLVHCLDKKLNGSPLYKHNMKATLDITARAHLKLHYQFVALIDMKLHAQNQLYTSISF